MTGRPRRTGRLAFVAAVATRPRHAARPPRSRWKPAARTAVLFTATGAALVGAADAPVAPGLAPAAPPSGDTAPLSPSPSPAPLADAPTGELLPVAGTGPAAGTGPVRAYRIEVEQGLAVDPAAFAADVEQTLSHPAGWAPVEGVTLQRTDAPAAAFTVTLASPRTTDRLCAPLRTAGRFSCFNGERAVLNADRWRNGAPAYGADVASYRQYLVNHEVGHALGNRHTGCPAAGAPAPVMVQQSIGLEGCAPNPWPTATGG